MSPDFAAIPDERLISLTRGGDAGAFDALVRRHFGLVYSIALARLGDRDTAEDLAQEVFLRVHLAMDTLKSSRHFPSWLGTVTRNLATDWQRRQGRVERLLDRIPLEHLSPADEMKKAVAPEAPSRLEEEDTARLLGQALDRLDPALREVVLLHYMEDLSKSDIARQLGVHPSTVSRQLDAALRRLRRYVGVSVPQAAKGLRPRPKAVARTVLLPGAVAALSVTQKSALAKAAVAGLPAVAKGFAAGHGGGLFSGPIRFLHHLKAANAAGGLPMGGVKGIVIATAGVAVVTAGVCFYAAESSGKGGPPVPPAPPQLAASFLTPVPPAPVAPTPTPFVREVRSGGAPPKSLAPAPTINVSATPARSARSRAEPGDPAAYLTARMVTVGRSLSIQEFWIGGKVEQDGGTVRGETRSSSMSPPMLKFLNETQVPLADAVEALKAKTGYQIDVGRNTTGKIVNLTANEKNFYDVLDHLCRSSGLVWWLQGQRHIFIDNALNHADLLQPEFRQAVQKLAAECEFDTTDLSDGGVRLTPKPDTLPARGGPDLSPEIYGDQLKPSDPTADPKVSLSITQGTIQDLAQSLSTQLGKPVSIKGPNMGRRFDVSVQDLSLSSALDIAGKEGHIRWWEDGRGQLFVGYAEYCYTLIFNEKSLEKGLDMISQWHHAYWTKRPEGNQVGKGVIYEIHPRDGAVEPTPPPVRTYSPGDEPVSVMFKNAEAINILQLFAKQAHYTLEYAVPRERLSAGVTINVQDVPLREALDTMLSQINLSAEILPNRKIRIVEKRPDV